MSDPRLDLSHLLRHYADTDEGEARAGDLANVLTEQDLIASAIPVNEPEDGGPAGWCVYVEPARADQAEIVAQAFEAEPDSALDYLTVRGVEPTRPVRPGCGLFWFFPLILILMGVFQLVGIGTGGSRTIGAAMVAAGVLMVVASRWIAAQDLSDPDDVERGA